MVGLKKNDTMTSLIITPLLRHEERSFSVNIHCDIYCLWCGHWLCGHLCHGLCLSIVGRVFWYVCCFCRTDRNDDTGRMGGIAYDHALICDNANGREAHCGHGGNCDARYLRALGRTLNVYWTENIRSGISVFNTF